MTLRNLTLSAVAVLSMGTAMAAAQTATTEMPAPPVAVPAAEAPAEVQAGAAPAAAPETAAPAAAAPADAAAVAPSAPEVVTADPVAETADPSAAGHTAEAPADPAAAADHAAAPATHAGGHVDDISFSFEGPFGKFDQFQLQRGLQVYTEVCSGCHGLKQVPIRTLHDVGGPGLPEDQVRAYAANLPGVADPVTGEERPREWTDHFPMVPDVEATGPDLSLMAKARAGFHGPYGTGLNQLFRGIGGPEYIHALMVGYTGETVEQAGTTLYVNNAFPGGHIAMPPPLSDGQVTYEDGTEATVDQMGRDVAAFLMWTAEPHMMARKQGGLVSVVFLIVLSALLYLTNKRLWWPHKHPDAPLDARTAAPRRDDPRTAGRH